MMEDPVIDSKFMERCLALALQAEGRTAPNPIVGAVIVDKHGDVVGEGYHQKAGEPHAEVYAFDAAGEKAHGGTLYVNLEPCCHHGRTPPCSERVTASGVKRVVVGMQDPNPKVAGGGIKQLRDHGITVDVGVLEEECRWANRGFIKRITAGRPWVCLKMAATLDGRIADRERSSRWITGAEARKHVHELRNRFDCILIGGETALRDDPELTVREIEGARNPHRAVVDPKLKLAATARLLHAAGDVKAFLFANADAAQWRARGFGEHVEVVSLGEGSSGRLPLSAVLRALAERRINSVLCEGGGRLAASLLHEKLVDEVQWIMAPKLLG
ncbi:MAG: bifunctional diaminohydroxyphosphoribosylaminopyrimidine deaminase/5-amino-6-(5-phosphoribosylamino)uracil reductase RibD, partial [Terriglobales bacterium]